MDIAGADGRSKKLVDTVEAGGGPKKLLGIIGAGDWSKKLVDIAEVGLSSKKLVDVVGALFDWSNKLAVVELSVNEKKFLGPSEEVFGSGKKVDAGAGNGVSGSGKKSVLTPDRFGLFCFSSSAGAGGAKCGLTVPLSSR